MSLEPEAPPRDPPPWLPLLRRLTQLSGAWGVWKNVDRALAGYGDIDSVSIPLDRDRLLHEFYEWASNNDMSPVFVCPHLPGSVLGVAVRDREELVELQLCEQAIFRGSTLFTARDLAPMMMVDQRGFRRLRPGSEGLLLLFYNSMRHGSRPLLHGEKASRPVELMRRDPEGMEAATQLFGSVRDYALRLATAATDGGWERVSAVRVEMWAAARGLRDPRLLAARAKLRVTGGRYCPLLPVLRRGRRLHGNIDEWLSRAVRIHESAGS